MENAKKFFEEVVKTEEAKALLAAAGQPETDEARVAAYIDVAAKLGVELTAEEIKEYYESSCAPGTAEIDDKELAQLVGGAANAQCGSTYVQGENCLLNDQCNKLWQDYTIREEEPAKTNDRIWAEMFSLHFRKCGHLSTQSKYNEKIAARNKAK